MHETQKEQCKFQVRRKSKRILKNGSAAAWKKPWEVNPDELGDGPIGDMSTWGRSIPTWVQQPRLRPGLRCRAECQSPKSAAPSAMVLVSLGHLQECIFLLYFFFSSEQIRTIREMWKVESYGRGTFLVQISSKNASQLRGQDQPFTHTCITTFIKW